MEYCKREVILPVPFNLVNYALDVLSLRCCRQCLCPPADETDAAKGCSQRARQYLDLLKTLCTKYINDEEGGGGGGGGIGGGPCACGGEAALDNAREALERAARELRRAVAEAARASGHQA